MTATIGFITSTIFFWGLGSIFASTAFGFLPIRSSRYVGSSADLSTRSSTFCIENKRRWCHRESRVSRPLRRSSSVRLPASKDETNVFPRQLIDSLDLGQIVGELARYSATRRGYEALLSTVQQKPPQLEGSRSESILSKRWRERYGVDVDTEGPTISPIAFSIEQIQSEYALVEEATVLLSSTKEGTDEEDSDFLGDITYPPLYGEDSSPYDTETIPQTDDDEWLHLPPEEFTVEHILQAEQVINKLLEIQKWSQRENVRTWTPNLARMGSTIDDDDQILPLVYQDVFGVVEIIRVKSVSDPSGKASYSLRVNDDGFPVLRLLREKEQKILEKGGKDFDKDLIAIRTEIDEVTGQIVSNLAQKVKGASKTIDHGLQVAARLDVLLSKAAYALSFNGVVPVVKTEEEICVENFLHPVLLQTIDDRDSVVPIDLRLSSNTGEQALVISGPNGGGKTLSMKSFGLVSILTKMGIPIPITEGSKKPRVDYIDEIFVNIGDQQSVLDGESTWTSILNSCASMIQSIDHQNDKSTNDSYLVLLDELGTGTDPESGGAVAQAVLEELISKSCKVVVTTHLPRLKALSFNDDRIGCAAVLLDYGDQSTFQRPSFKLEYGLIGESHALNAASRCVPSLPQSVLSRASDLLNDASESEESGTHKSYIQALTGSMEEQLRRSKIATSSMEEAALDSLQCRKAMISLARSYECYLERKLENLESTFQKLRKKGSNDYELVGETLAELKAVKKRIVSQEEDLAAKGLQVLPLNYVLSPGESVVIISNDEWEGMTAKVVSDGSNGDPSLESNQVLVKPSFSLHAWDDVILTDIDPMRDRVLILQRHDVAIWNVDNMYSEDSYRSKPATSIPNSKQRVNSLLSSIDSVSKKNGNKAAAKKKQGGKTFQSSRQRKAANKGKRKKK